MRELPVALENGLIYFTEEVLAAAGRHVHLDRHPVHTHSFVEIALVVAGAGIHSSPLGQQSLHIGDVLVLRPGAWHAFENCDHLEVINCCFGVELLRGELGWTRTDPLLGYLLWDGPYAPGRQGVLPFHLEPDELAECVVHAEALETEHDASPRLHRADVIGRLSIILGHLARAAHRERVGLPQPPGPSHPAVVSAIRMLEASIDDGWTLDLLADRLHLAPNYLVRLFKSTTGLPPMAYLARQRAESAAVLLLHSDRSMARIGAAVGWPDQNYFARRFRAHFGMSPTIYRQQGLRDPQPRGVVLPV